MKPAPWMLSLLLAGIPAWAADLPGEAVNLEAHGFVSFGHLRTWGNNWLEDDTTGGTNDLWEAGINGIARPMEGLRLGAQAFHRKLGKFDNGRIDLDWAYADARFSDPLGVQVGRVKLPLGLYNESVDLDAGRASVFQPTAVYFLRTRDLMVSVDGGKAYGFADLGGAGSLEYAAYAGGKRFDLRGGLAGYFSEIGLGDRIDRMSCSWIGGGMVHWNTPVDGLAFRISVADLHGLEVDGTFTANGLSDSFRVRDYFYAVASAQYETEPVLYAVELAKLHGQGVVTVPALGLERESKDYGEQGYVSATWHALRWLDVYGAFEAAWSDPDRRSQDNSYTPVVALAVMPLRHWTVKAEFQDVHGVRGAMAVDNPGGIEKRWQILAIKTTMDF